MMLGLRADHQDLVAWSDMARLNRKALTLSALSNSNKSTESNQ